MQLKAVLSDRIYLTNRDGLLDELSDQLRHTIKPKFTPRGARPRPIVILDLIKVGGCLSIPIGRQDLIPEDYIVVDKREGTIVNYPNIVADVELRDSQQSTVDKVTTNCIINAPPAYGKTFTALHIAKKLSLKTLIIVHTTALRDQWEDEYKFLFGKACGIVGGGKDTSADQCVAVGNIQTVRNKDTKWLSQFGAIILDEVHHTPSKTFNETLNRCKAKYKIGLSATLTRKDGMHVLLGDYVGQDVIIPEDDGNYLEPKVLMVESGIELPSAKAWADRVTALFNDPNYIQIVYDLITMHIEKGYSILALSTRVELLEMLSEELPDSLLIVGKTLDRKSKLSEVKNHNPLLGSMQIFSEGISVNHLDCLVIASPMNNDSLLEQIVGRITRKAKDKRQPLVIDIVLDGPTAARQASARRAFYKKMGWNIAMVS